MTRGRFLVVVLLVSSGVAMLASGGSSAAAPTQLYYNLTVDFGATQHFASYVLSYDDNGAVVDRRLAHRQSATMIWKSKTNESILLRNLPGGRVTWLSSGDSTVDFRFAENGAEGISSYAPGYISSPACERSFRGGTGRILTTGKASIASATRARQTLIFTVTAPKSELTKSEAGCSYQRYEFEPPVEWHLRAETYTNQQRAYVSALPGLGVVATVDVGSNLVRNFGRRTIQAERTQTISLDGVGERDRLGRPSTVTEGHVRAVVRVRFTRCPEPRPCR
jgi:hypothetical protein